MRFEQVISAMKEGKKVRRKNWGNNLAYIFADEHDIIDISQAHELFIFDCEADDWEIFEEEKKTLSDKIIVHSEYSRLKIDVVKEFIQDLKQKAKDKQIEIFIKDIDELAGEKLR